MLSSPIEQIISAAGAPLLTNIFLVALLCVFFISARSQKRDKHHALTQYTPTLLTSLGILGTFMGIVAGLLEFDTANIDTSIGPLLDGLKTAFITSLAGMLLSIIYKGLSASGKLSPKTDDEQSIAPDDITAADLYSAMTQQVDGIEQLRKAIGGDSEASLVGQFKLLRSDINDNQKQADKQLRLATETLTSINTAALHQQANFKAFEERLWIKLQDFADMMSKSATEQVIEALKTVIQDFNNNLTEQFGENFKQLNAAVLELVTWQENYKQQLSDMKVQYDHGVQAITQTESSVANIDEKAQSIPAAMESLVKVMEVNQHQINELAQHLGAFEQVRDRAVEAVPEIRNQIDLAIAGAREASETMAKGVIDSTDRLKLVVVESADNYRDTIDRTRGALDDAATTTANSSIEIKEQFSSALTDINNNMRNLINELQAGGTQLMDEFKKGNTEAKELNKKLITEIREGNQAINASFSDATKDVSENTSKMLNAFNSSAEDIQKSLARTIEQFATEHRQQADRVFAGLEKSIESALANTGESVEKQVHMIDKAMESEVTKVMQSMGDALASISGQFTRDYSKLTREMSNIVRQAV